jgi:hypothetical protein
MCFRVFKDLSAHQSQCPLTLTDAGTATKNMYEALAHFNQVPLQTDCPGIDWDIPVGPLSSYRSLPTAPHIRKAMGCIYAKIDSALQADRTNSNTWFILHYLHAWILHAPGVPLSPTQILALVATRLQQFFEGQYFALHEGLTQTQAPYQHTVTTEEYQIIKASRLAMAAEFRRAGQVLAPKAPLRDLSRPGTAEIFQNSFPTEALPNRIPTLQPTPLFSQKEVSDAIRSSPKQSAPGPSGLRYDHLRQLEIKDIAAPITNILNLIFSNKAPSAYYNLLRTCSATLIEKTETTIRPIMVQEVFVRMISRLTFDRAIKEARPPPRYHFALCSKNGTSQVATAVKMLLVNNPGLFVKSIDIKSAFSYVSRAKLADAIQRSNCNILQHFFNFSLTGRLIGLTRNQEVSANCDSGLPQGDPMSPFLFAFLLQTVIEQMEGDFADVNVFCYVDDITFVGEEAKIQAILERFSVLLADINLKIEPGKTQQYSPSQSTPDKPAVDTGIVILGVPIGTPEFINAYFEKKVLKSLNKMGLLCKAKTLQVKLLLIRNCIVQSLVYLARNVEPEFSKPHLAFHNERVVKQFLLLLASNSLPEPIEPTPNLLWQISLPIKSGGIGLTNLAPAAQLIFTASFRESVRDLVVSNPNMLLTYSTFINGDSHLAAILHSGYNEACALNEAFSSSPLNQPLSCSNNLQAKYVHHFFQASLKNPPTPPETTREAIRLDGVSQPHANDFLNTIPATKNHIMHDPVFNLSCRRVLNLPTIPASAKNLRCTCGQPLTDQHAEVCTQTGEQSRRHNDLRDYFHHNIVQPLKLDASIEDVIPGTQLRYDLKFRHPKRTNASLFLDFSIVSHMQLAYVNMPLSDFKKARLAKDEVVKFKNNKYGPYTADPDEFIAIIFDSFGGIHHQAKNLLQLLSTRNTNFVPSTFAAPTALTYHIQSLSVIIHAGTAKSIMRCVKKAYLQAGLHSPYAGGF